MVALLLAAGWLADVVSSDPDARLVSWGLFLAGWFGAVVVSVWPEWAADVWRRARASLGRRP
jgi:hypothetical protein